MSDDIPAEQARRDQCFYRTDRGSCLRVDILLGCGYSMPLSMCNECWSLGGCNTEAGEAWCWSLAAQESQIWKRPENWRRAPREILVALTVHHFTPEERKVALANEDFRRSLDRVSKWQKVRHTWEPATIASFFKSQASGLFGKKVDLTIKRKRHISCSGRDLEGGYVKAPCPFYKESAVGEYHYCGACGCGDKEVARLDVDEGGYDKLDYPYLECPLQEEGFSNQVSFTTGVKA